MIYYLGVRFAKHTNNALFEFRKRNNLDHYSLPSLGFHCTIVHSKTSFKYLIQPLASISTIVSAHKSNIRLYETSLALNFYEPWLHDQNTECLFNGAKSDFPSYTSHITLAEGVKDMPSIPVPFPIEINITELFYMEW
jgi:hypothetical protein